jgi:hypothetical protein
VTWLTDLVEAALPLWPDPAVTPTAGTVGWALLPPPAPGAVDSGYGPDTLRHWREDVVNLAPATLAGQTLAILRWAPVAAVSRTPFVPPSSRRRWSFREDKRRPIKNCNKEAMQ